MIFDISQIIRCLSEEKPFKFKHNNMPDFRRQIKNELLTGRIQDDPCHHMDNSKYHRRISNHDSETCWLNSCIQLLLVALDYSPNFVMSSSLGKLLELAQSKTLIDPRPIKRLIQDELDSNSGRYQYILTEQQCARDLLIILGEKEETWRDVHNLVWQTCKQTITCQNCQAESFSYATQLYSEVSCPEDNVSLKNFLENNFNGVGEDLEYLCGSCKVRGIAKQSFQLVTEASSSYFVVCLKRSEENYSNRVIATHDITLVDSNNHPRVYTPLSIIYHQGGVEHDVRSVRHYMCDLKDVKNDKWFHTSDASEPKLLKTQQVTKNGFIVLYKRKAE